MKIIDWLNGFYRECDYPALLEQTRKWGDSRPLSGVKVLDATPLYRNTFSKYAALLAGGAELAVAVGDQVPYDPAMRQKLADFGIRLVASGADEPFDVVLDCAGANARVPSKYGYVELTRSGVAAYRHAVRPVIVADSSRIKAIETTLGTGEGFLRAMKHLGYGDFAGRKVVVFGCGKVGRGIVLYAQKAGAEVIAVDDVAKVAPPEGVRMVSMHNAAAIKAALDGAWCVVSATGVKDAWRGRFDPTGLLTSDTLIANMGVGDEFGGEIPAERVLNNKRPLNFILDEPTRLRYIEATLALHNAAALELLEGRAQNGLQAVPPELERGILNVTVTRGAIGDEIREMGLL